MMKFKMFFFALVLTGALSFSACEDPMATETKNIVELAQETDNLSTLVTALEQVDLANTLTGNGPYTVFAPNNQAFQNLLDSNDDWDSLADIDDATLTEVLLFHVYGGEITADQLSDTYVKTLKQGPNDEFVDLQVNVTGGVNFNGSAAPVNTDLEASNGIVHIINEVMLPPTVVDKALNNPEFSTLVEALTRTDLTTDFVALLSSDGPFTVFAPTNASFAALLESNADWNELADIPVATLEAVLKYHVIPGANVQSDELVDDQTINAVEGTLAVDLSDGAKLETSSGQTVDIVITDVQATNGVIHAVNQVLIP